MNINLEYYKVFYVVAKHKNITKASDELKISQPAISKCIRQLEDQLGGTLFTRTKRGVVLTEEGESFYKYINQALEYIHNAESKFSDMMNLDIGTIRIGSSTTLTKTVLMPYLEEFHKKYPKIKIEIETNISTDLLSRLRQGLLDIVILNMPNKLDDDLNYEFIKEVHDCFIVGEEYKQLCDKKLHIKELMNFPLVFQLAGSTTRKYADKYASDNGVVFEPDMELAGFSLVAEFTRIGFGIGYSTEEFICNELRDKKLYKLNVEPIIPKREVAITYSRKNLPNFCTRKLIEIILKNK